jgi:hypothetical protein
MRQAPAGINQRYVTTLILQNGPAMRAAQERISKRIDAPTAKKRKAAAPARIA